MAVEGGSSDRGPDEVDDRFAELILAEFGERSAEEAHAPAPSEPLPDQPGTPAHPSASEVTDKPDSLPEVFSLDEAWERVETDEPEPYTPEDLPPMKPPPSAVILSVVLIVGGLFAGLVLGTRQQLAGLSGVLVGISIVAGLALLMAQAVRRRGNEDPDDDGARL